MATADSTPACDARTVEVAPARAAARHGSGLAHKDASEMLSLTPISPVPQRTLSADLQRIGAAVVKMPVPSDRAGSSPAHDQGRSPDNGGNSIARTAPTPSTIRGEDR